MMKLKRTQTASPSLRPHRYDGFLSETASGTWNALLDHRLVGTFSSRQAAVLALSQRMEREHYHPAVWEVTTTGQPARLVPMKGAK